MSLSVFMAILIAFLSVSCRENNSAKIAHSNDEFATDQITPTAPRSDNNDVVSTDSNHEKAIMLDFYKDSYGGGGSRRPVVVSSYKFAYVTPALNATTVDQFLLGNDGLLLSSTTAIPANGVETFGQMTFATVNGIQYAYILDPNGAVYWCSIAADGSFSNCAATASLPSFGSWQARGIAFATFNAHYAYIVDPGNNYAYQCVVEETGNFSNCQQAPSPYSLATLAPYGIAFATDTNQELHAYIADAGAGGMGNFGYVLVCSMQNDGSFNSCSQTPSLGVPNWIPYAIAFTTIHGTKYAYVADNGTGTPGHVYRCSLNSDGSFVNSGCIQTPANDSLLTNWYPYYIAFKTLKGTQYAYVVNSSGSSVGNIYRCILDNSGLLTDCVLTPDTPPLSWQPSGIAFRDS